MAAKLPQWKTQAGDEFDDDEDGDDEDGDDDEEDSF